VESGWSAAFCPPAPALPDLRAEDLERRGSERYSAPAGQFSKRCQVSRPHLSVPPSHLHVFVSPFSNHFVQPVWAALDLKFTAVGQSFLALYSV
jgi:hypothetical protein